MQATLAMSGLAFKGRERSQRPCYNQFGL